MKKTLIFLLMPFLLLSCSKTKTVTETVQNHLQSQMKNPESFKVEQISVELDTVPFYLNREILSAADDVAEALDAWTRYKDRSSYLWADEKALTIRDLTAAQSVLANYCKAGNQGEPLIHYVALVKYSGTNAMGGTVSNRAIVIVDKDDPKKVLGKFSVDNDFIKQIISIKYATDGELNVKQNQFGKFETEGLPRIEQFIFNK